MCFGCVVLGEVDGFVYFDVGFCEDFFGFGCCDFDEIVLV